MSSTVAVARRLLLVRMLRAETMLLEPAALGMERTDMRSSCLASFLLRVLWRLIMVEVSGFKSEPTSDAGAAKGPMVSSEMAVIVSDAPVPEDLVDWEAIVERRLPVEGNIRGPKIWRGRNGFGIRSGESGSADEEGTAESASWSGSSTLGMSSMEVVSRRGDDMDRPLVGEYWLLRLAPRRFRLGVGVTDTSLSLSCAVDSVMVSEVTADGASSMFCVSMVMSRLERLRRRLLPLPLPLPLLRRL